MKGGGCLVRLPFLLTMGLSTISSKPPPTACRCFEPLDNGTYVKPETISLRVLLTNRGFGGSVAAEYNQKRCYHGLQIDLESLDDYAKSYFLTGEAAHRHLHQFCQERGYPEEIIDCSGYIGHSGRWYNCQETISLPVNCDINVSYLDSPEQGYRGYIAKATFEREGKKLVSHQALNDDGQLDFTGRLTDSFDYQRLIFVDEDSAIRAAKEYLAYRNFSLATINTEVPIEGIDCLYWGIPLVTSQN